MYNAPYNSEEWRQIQFTIFESGFAPYNSEEWRQIQFTIFESGFVHDLSFSALSGTATGVVWTLILVSFNV